jgi:hypothetical protein
MHTIEKDLVVIASSCRKLRSDRGSRHEAAIIARPPTVRPPTMKPLAVPGGRGGIAPVRRDDDPAVAS